MLNFSYIAESSFFFPIVHGFIFIEVESELGTCNEALDEMDIIETESMCEEISNPINLDDLQEFVKQGLQNVKIRKEFMVTIYKSYY